MAGIVVNNKELNLDDPKTHNEIMVSEWINKEREKRKSNPIVRLIDLTPLRKNQKVFRQPKGFDVSATKTNKKTGQKERWIYTDRDPKISKSGEKFYLKKHLRFFREAEFNINDDPMLLYMLINVVDVSQFGFVVEDKESIAQKKLDKRRKAVQVQDLIDNRLTASDIVRFAGRWGIKTTGKGENQLREELWERVQSLETSAVKEGKEVNTIFKKFVDEANSDGTIVKIGMYFYKALQDKKVSFNPQKRTWFWTASNEPFGGYVPPEFIRTKEEYIIEYLTNNQEEQDMFLLAIGGEVSEIAEDSDDYKMITVPMKKKAWAKKKLGLDIPLVKLEEQDRLIEEFMAKSQTIPQEQTT